MKVDNLQIGPKQFGFPHVVGIHTGVNFFLQSKVSSHKGRIVEAHVKCHIYNQQLTPRLSNVMLTSMYLHIDSFITLQTLQSTH